MKMMEDEEVIRRRLLIDGDGTGDARMMTKFTRALLKFCSSDDSQTDLEAQHERLLTTLSSIEESSIKWDNIRQMNSYQIENYNELSEVTKNAVEDAQEALKVSKQDLEDARKVRANCLEYHALAKLIQEHPDRQSTNTKIEEVTDSLDKLRTSRDSLEDTLDLRKKQLHALFTTLHQLEESLHKDADTPPREATPQKPIVDLTEEMEICN